ncbi:hypothetical protein BY996DRAFT_6499592 [Phakopsora pachyrhizi]|nr:hypothetical protein BY996DRAFT_6499592 [Phakopsora pachyrhizi]
MASVGPSLTLILSWKAVGGAGWSWECSPIGETRTGRSLRQHTEDIGEHWPRQHTKEREEHQPVSQTTGRAMRQRGTPAGNLGLPWERTHGGLKELAEPKNGQRLESNTEREGYTRDLQQADCLSH